MDSDILSQIVFRTLSVYNPWFVGYEIDEKLQWFLLSLGQAP